MRDTITFYQVALAKPWTADAPGAVEEPVGRVLYFGEGHPREGRPRSRVECGWSGWHSQGWHRVLGHGASEIIPTSHLAVSKVQYKLDSHSDLPWDDMRPYGS